MENLLEYALSYAERGWLVFPCREKPSKEYINRKGKNSISKEKTPYTRNGFKDASLEKEQIVRWWKQYPQAMIGISCGESGLFVIDIDTKNGRDGMSNYMKLGIDTEEALHSLTPSGGMHVLFKSNKGRSTTNILQGIDTRGIGGYFIVPPSRVIEGRIIGNYVAVDDWSREPPPISDDLLRKIKVAKNKKGYSTKIGGFKESKEETVRKAKLALEKLPSHRCENYHSWIEIGLSLFELGLDGLILWDTWSKQSPKYIVGACEEKWETFEPDEIGVGSLFFWVKEEGYDI